MGGTVLFGLVFIARASTTINGERSFTLFDDALVSMRYAHNLADGHGLVWNAGQPGVEGYTNLLWTLWMALVHLTGVPLRYAGLVVSLTGLGLLVANLCVIAALCRALAPQRTIVERTALLLTATCFPLLYWTLRGMEVGLVALVMSTATLFAVRFVRGHPRAITWLCLACVVGVLTRTDVVVPLAVILGFTLLSAPRPRRRIALIAPAAMALTLGVHTLLRVRWYGEALPNTYALKLAGISLADRLQRGVTVAALLLVVELVAPVGLAILAFTGAHTAERRELLLLTGIPVACLAYAVYVGGDAWEWMLFADRYVAPALPLLFIVCGFGVARLVALADAQRARASFLAGGVLMASAGVAAVCPFPRSLLQLEGKTTRSFVLPVAGAAVALFALAVLIRKGVAVARGRLATAAVALLLVVVTAGPALRRWEVNRGEHVGDDAENALVAAAINASTSSDASVAVTWAGSIPYFTGRPAIDLLGKSDPVIARSAPHAISLYPGHMRWDYGYSIGTLYPDVVVKLWMPTDGDRADLERWGYAPIDRDGVVWVLTDSPRVDVPALRREISKIEPITIR